MNRSANGCWKTSAAGWKDESNGREVLSITVDPASGAAAAAALVCHQAAKEIPAAVLLIRPGCWEPLRRGRRQAPGRISPEKREIHTAQIAAVAGHPPEDGWGWRGSFPFPEEASAAVRELAGLRRKAAAPDQRDRSHSGHIAYTKPLAEDLPLRSLPTRAISRSMQLPRGGSRPRHPHHLPPTDPALPGRSGNHTAAPTKPPGKGVRMAAGSCRCSDPDRQSDTTHPPSGLSRRLICAYIHKLNVL